MLIELLVFMSTWGVYSYYSSYEALNVFFSPVQQSQEFHFGSASSKADSKPLTSMPRKRKKVGERRKTFNGIDQLSNSIRCTAEFLCSVIQLFFLFFIVFIFPNKTKINTVMGEKHLISVVVFFFTCSLPGSKLIQLWAQVNRNTSDSIESSFAT